MPRLIDLDSPQIKYLNGFEEKFMGQTVLEWLDDMPTVDAVPSTDVDELKMRLIGAEAAVNGMREQINRMVIINSEKVSVVRCGECKYAESVDDSEDGYICKYHRGTMWFSGCYCSWGVKECT